MKSRITGLFLALTFMMLIGTMKSESNQLTVWTTNGMFKTSYEELAHEWNQAHPERIISINVTVYSQSRISSKLARAFDFGTLFDSSGMPDLVDIDYMTYFEQFSDQRTELYPLQNLLDKHVSEKVKAASKLFTRSGFCFVLPYGYGDLALCYPLSLLEDYPDWKNRTLTYETLSDFAAEYYENSGKALVSIDYLDFEMFYAILSQAWEAYRINVDCFDGQLPYDKTIELLRTWRMNGWSEYMDTGSVSSNAFADAIKKDARSCFVTTVAKLAILGSENPQLASIWGITALPSFMANAKSVSLPASGTAIVLKGKNVVLARDFLEFCRFSEYARNHPLFYLGEGNITSEALLSSYWLQHNNIYLGTGDENVMSPDTDYLVDVIKRYPGDVLK